jgi:hypothetical protein
MQLDEVGYWVLNSAVRSKSREVTAERMGLDDKEMLYGTRRRLSIREESGACIAGIASSDACGRIVNCNDSLDREISSDEDDKESVCSFYSCVQELETSEEDGCIVSERGGKLCMYSDGVGYCQREECDWCRWRLMEWRTENRRIRRKVDKERRKRRNPFIPWALQKEWLTEFESSLQKTASSPVEDVLNLEFDDQKDPIQQAFGESALGFPTTRRPVDYHRRIDETTLDDDIESWFETSKIEVGKHLTPVERAKALRLLYSWKDLFCDDLLKLPATDLVTHKIPTVPAKPVRVKEGLYTQKEIAWQHENIPKMISAGIITYANSPWSAKSKFPDKKNGKLRMVHSYCPINDVTIKTNYPMKRSEPIINILSMPKFKNFWWTDGANGYWAVPMHRPHAYKSAFSCVLGQFAYLRMGQGLTGAPHTYAQLKDIMSGPIPAPHAEEPISGDSGDAAFMSFFDDDMGAGVSFEAQWDFLHHKYFPRVSWSKLTLSPGKSHFFMDHIDMLGFSAGPAGRKPKSDKLDVFRNYPVPTSEKELDGFVHLTTYLRNFIPGRAEHIRRMYTAVRKEPEWSSAKSSGKKRSLKFKSVGFEWNDEARASFDYVRAAILNNACYGGDPQFQYHLATDASDYAYGGVLFQLPACPAGTVFTKSLVPEMRIVQFISKKFLV